MKIRYLIFLLLFSSSLLIAGDNILDYFTAKSDGKVISLEWKSLVENSYQRYEIERSAANQNFSRISSVDAKGYSSVYNYTDNDAFMKRGDNNVISANVYSYRIKIVKFDDSYNYSNTIYVTHNVSGIRRTWGMIKEMFR